MVVHQLISTGKAEHYRQHQLTILHIVYLVSVSVYAPEASSYRMNNKSTLKGELISILSVQDALS